MLSIYVHRRGAFGVARFDNLGDARPLLRGTSDRTGSTFLVCIYQHLLIIAILEPMGIFLLGS